MAGPPPNTTNNATPASNAITTAASSATTTTTSSSSLPISSVGQTPNAPVTNNVPVGQRMSLLRSRVGQGNAGQQGNTGQQTNAGQGADLGAPAWLSGVGFPPPPPSIDFSIDSDDSEHEGSVAQLSRAGSRRGRRSDLESSVERVGSWLQGEGNLPEVQLSSAQRRSRHGATGGEDEFDVSGLTSRLNDILQGIRESAAGSDPHIAAGLAVGSDHQPRALGSNGLNLCPENCVRLLLQGVDLAPGVPLSFDGSYYQNNDPIDIAEAFELAGILIYTHDRTELIKTGEDRRFVDGFSSRRARAFFQDIPQEHTYIMRTGEAGGSGHYSVLLWSDGWTVIDGDEHYQVLDQDDNFTADARARIINPEVLWGLGRNGHSIQLFEATQPRLQFLARYILAYRYQGLEAAQMLARAYADTSQMPPVPRPPEGVLPRLQVAGRGQGDPASRVPAPELPAPIVPANLPIRLNLVETEAQSLASIMEDATRSGRAVGTVYPHYVPALNAAIPQFLGTSAMSEYIERADFSQVNNGCPEEVVNFLAACYGRPDYLSPEVNLRNIEFGQIPLDFNVPLSVARANGVVRAFDDDFSHFYMFDNGGTAEAALAMLNTLDRSSPYVVVVSDAAKREGHIMAMFFSRGRWYMYNSKHSGLNDQGTVQIGPAIIPLTDMGSLTAEGYQYLVRPDRRWGPNRLQLAMLRMNESSVNFLLNYIPMARSMGERSAERLVVDTEMFPQIYRQPNNDGAEEG